MGAGKVTNNKQDNYVCLDEDEIKNIAKAIMKESPNVEAHISAVITITYSEGYDLCVDVDYVDGKMSVDTSEEYYEDFEDEDEDEEE